jgi:pimeloyl-ACP methyl ester carboxylesterase
VDDLMLVAPANVLIMPQPDADSDLFASVRSKLDEDQQVEFDAFMEDYVNFKTLFTLSENDLIERQIKFGDYYAKALGTTTQVHDQGEPGGWMTWAQYISMGKRHDYSSALSVVHAPVLVIHGGSDLQSETASRIYAGAFPNATFKVIEGADHFSFEQQPDSFVDMVRTFLEGVN